MNFNRVRTFLVCGALALLVLALYWPVSGYPFINLDDPEYITQNPHVLSGLSWINVEWAFSTGYAANWHPLTWLSHMLDVQWFGLEAGRHHLVSVGFHAINTVLLLLVLRQMTGAFWRSALVAAVFGLHPLHVESVAWVAERKDVLSGFFFLLTLWSYARFAAGRKQNGISASWKSMHFWLSLAAFALGLMSKPMLVTLPFVLLLLDFWPLRRFQLDNAALRLKVLSLEKAPFFALSLASSIITYTAQNSAQAVGSVNALDPDARIANAALSGCKYFGKTFWPTDLAVFYPHPFLRFGIEDPLFTLPVLLALLALIAITAGVLLRLCNEPYLATGWFWFVGMLVPVIGFVQVGSQGMADRYMYLPMIGILIATIWASADAWNAWKAKPAALRNALPASAAMLVLVGCGALAWKQVRVWGSDVTLFEHALAVTSSNPQAHFNLATGYGKQGRFDAAIQHLNAALKIMPNYPEAHFNLGLAYMSEGKLPEAEEAYEETLRLAPGYLAARQNLGAVLMGLGKPDAALEQFEEIARIQPGAPESELNVGRALFALRRFPEAIEHLKNCLTLRPDAESYYCLALACDTAGRTAEALSNYQAALKLKPDSAVVLNDLAWLLATAHDSTLRNGTEAVRLAQQACELSGGKEARFFGTLDAAYAEAGRFEEALKTAETTRRLAELAGQKEILQAANERILQYKNNQPFHAKAR